MMEERQLIIMPVPNDDRHVTVAYKRHMPSGEKFGEFVKIPILDIIRVVPKLYEQL